MYICYSTMWSEGVVVAHTSDKGFAIGYDPCSGSIIYKPNLSDFEHDVICETENVAEAASYDTALYQRKYIDPEEYALYQKEFQRLN